MSGPAPPTIDEQPGTTAATAVMCGGSACRSAGKCAYQRLIALFDELGMDIDEVPCLGHCQGPVAVLPVGDDMAVVGSLRGGRRRRALLKSLTLGKLGPIQAMLLSGKRELRALRRVERTAARRP